MPVYRYRLAQVNETSIERQIPQSDVSSLVIGDSAALLYLDITVNASAKTDLDSYMDSLGWEFVSTDPSFTVEEQSSSAADKSSGAGRLTPDYPLSIGGTNQVDVAAGTGTIGYGGDYYQISWSSDNIDTTGYPEDTYYVYIDNAGTVQDSSSEPDHEQNILLGTFYYTGSQVATVAQEPAITKSIYTRAADFGSRLGAFIYNDGGLVQEMVTDLKIVSAACSAQHGLLDYTLAEIDSDDVGTNFFCWFDSADDGWVEEYFWLAFSSGKIPTEYWNDASQNATTALSANCTFTNGSPTVSTASDLTSEVSVGDMVWLDADGITYMNKVQSINATTITLEQNYGGAGGGAGASSVGKALPNITSTKYVKHLIIRTLDGNMHFIPGQEEYDTEDDAVNGGKPSIPDSISNSAMNMAYIIVQDGDTSLDGAIRDIRPLPFADKEGGSQGAGVVTDHGSLSGLADDDHTQYHNDTRGDARYYRETEFINTSTGAPDAGKPIKLDASGKIDNTMSGDVVGPSSATDNAIVRFDGTSGILIQNSGPSINDSGYMGVNSAPLSNAALRTTGIALPDFGVNVGATTVYNDYDVDVYSTFSFHSATGDFEVTGFSNTAQGKVVRIHNASDYNMLLKHEDSRSTAANRLALPNDKDIEVTPNGSMEFTYLVQTGSSRWYVTGTPQPFRDLYDAIVAPSGGDYTLPSAAFAAGAQSVFVRSGTYVETANVVIPSGGYLQGEDIATIDLSGGFSITIDGNGGTTETTGTIAVTTDSAAVVGTGTTFTNLSPGDYIAIGALYYPIASITDNLNLTLAFTYRGESRSGISFVATSMFTSCAIHRIRVTGATGTGLLVRGASSVIIDSVTLYGNVTNMLITDCGSVALSGVAITHGGGIGLTLANCRSIGFSNCVVSNNDGDGIVVTTGCETVKIEGSSFSNNDGDGVSMEGNAVNTLILDSISTHNNGKGFNTEATTSHTTIASCLVDGSGDIGIDVDGAENIIADCSIVNGASAGIWAGDECTITGCHVSGNAGVGVSFDGDAGSIACNNHIHDNTGDGIDITATLNTNIMIANNYIVDNGPYGIDIAAGAGTNGIRLLGNYVSGHATADINNLNATTLFSVEAAGKPAQGDVIYYNGTAWIRLNAGTSGQVLTTQGVGANPTWASSSSTFGSEYQDAASEGESSTTSATYQQKLRLTTSSLPAGDYYIGWFFEHAMGGDDKQFGFRTQIDDTTTMTEGIIECKGQYVDSQWRAVAGFYIATLTAASHTIDLDYADVSGDTAYIRRARIAIWRVS